MRLASATISSVPGQAVARWFGGADGHAGALEFRGHAADSTVYNLLHRHGWRKLMPRPFHPKRNLAAQNAFKKATFPMP